MDLDLPELKCPYCKIPCGNNECEYNQEYELESKLKLPKEALRYNKGKLPMHLVPADAISALASVLEYGASKYAERNWELGAKYSVPYSSLMRHLLAWWGGEDRDGESGLPHTHHILMNAAMLVRYAEEFKESDDRPGVEND